MKAAERVRLEELEEAVARCGWEVRRGGGDFRSGLLVWRGRRIVYLNREAGEAELRKVLAEALLTGHWESIYLSPALRRWLEEEVAEAAGRGTT